MAHYEHYLRHVTFILGPDALFHENKEDDSDVNKTISEDNSTALDNILAQSNTTIQESPPTQD